MEPESPNQDDHAEPKNQPGRITYKKIFKFFAIVYIVVFIFRIIEVFTHRDCIFFRPENNAWYSGTTVTDMDIVRFKTVLNPFGTIKKTTTDFIYLQGIVGHYESGLTINLDSFIFILGKIETKEPINELKSRLPIEWKNYQRSIQNDDIKGYKIYYYKIKDPNNIQTMDVISLTGYVGNKIINDYHGKPDD